MAPTLLCIDDSRTIQQAVAICFAHEGFEVVAAGSGQDGVAKSQQSPPTLVLLDTSLPDGNCYDVCQSLRANPSTSQVPVLIMTGTVEVFDEERAKTVGMTDHIAKPFDSKSLIEKVRVLTGITAPVQPVAAPAAPPTSALPTPPAARPAVAPAAPVAASPAAAPTPAVAPPRQAAAPPRTATQPMAGMAWQPTPTAPRAPSPAAPATPAVAATPPAATALSPASPPAALSPSAAAAAPVVARRPTPTVTPPPAAAPPLAASPPLAAAPPPAATPVVKADPFGFGLDDGVDISMEESNPPLELTLEPPPSPAAPPAAPAVSPPAAMSARPDVAPAAALAAPAPAATAPVVSSSVPAISGSSQQALSKAGVDSGQLAAAVREVIEQVVWEVVPDMAETLIREELNRLLASRGSK